MPPATQQQNNQNNNTTTNGNGAARQPKVPTAIEAISKISKILEQLTPADRKRVLAFVNESSVDAE